MEYLNVSEISRWTKETSEALTVFNFGFTLEEVEKFQGILNANNNQITSDATAKQNEYQGVQNQMKVSTTTQNFIM